MNWLKRKLKKEVLPALQPPDLPPAPRHLKYAWAALVSLLMVVSVALDSGSRWLPLVHQMIDLLQQQNLPNGSRSDTSPFGGPPPPSAAKN
jgi:hypothetical protein